MRRPGSTEPIRCSICSNVVGYRHQRAVPQCLEGKRPSCPPQWRWLRHLSVARCSALVLLGGCRLLRHRVPSLVLAVDLPGLRNILVHGTAVQVKPGAISRRLCVCEQCGRVENRDSSRSHRRLPAVATSRDFLFGVGKEGPGQTGVPALRGERQMNRRRLESALLLLLGASVSLLILGVAIIIVAIVST